MPVTLVCFRMLPAMPVLASTMEMGAIGMDLRQKRTDILRIAAQYGTRNLRVFGSVARGDDPA
jgi:hypothetical protein